MDQAARFWDRHARRYSLQPIADEAAYQRKLEITRRYLQPDMEVLELGCGTGGTAIIHAPRVRHILATDVSQRMLEIARDKATAAGVENVTFEQTTVEGLEASDGGFDVVLGLSILHLLRDKGAAIAKAHRLLKPGGAFVTSTVCLGETLGMRAIGVIARALRPMGLAPFLTVFTVDDLTRSLIDAGFVIEHRWQPARGKAWFVVAKKPLRPQLRR